MFFFERQSVSPRKIGHTSEALRAKSRAIDFGRAIWTAL